MQVLVSVSIVVVLAGLMILFTVLNQKTPKPAGSVRVPDCKGCRQYACTHNPAIKKEGEE